MHCHTHQDEKQGLPLPYPRHVNQTASFHETGTPGILILVNFGCVEASCMYINVHGTLGCSRGHQGTSTRTQR